MIELVNGINMNAIKEQAVKQYATCLEYQCTQLHETTLHYEKLFKSWDVFGADIFVINNKAFLCIVDFRVSSQL